MSLRDEIIRIISQDNIYPIAITEETDLYRDLHFDSLAFVGLLVRLEERYHITIELSEMEPCRVVGSLIDTIERKRRGTSI